MMQTISLQQTPSQRVVTVLDGQNFQIHVYQKNNGMYCDVQVDAVEIVNGILCLDATPIICRDYLGVRGNLVFIDTQGDSAPYYTGLDDRYFLTYLTADEFAKL